MMRAVEGTRAIETEILACLIDQLLRGLPAAQAEGLREQFERTELAGADVSEVVPRYMIALLTDPKYGVARFVVGYPKVERAVEAVARLYGRALSGDRPTAAEWAEAAKAAATASVSAARAAASAREWASRAAEASAWTAREADAAAEAPAWATRAAEAAARTAEAARAAKAEAAAAVWAALVVEAAAGARAAAEAPAWATRAAADAAAESARAEARADHYRWQVGVLFDLLSEAPVPPPEGA